MPQLDLFPPPPLDTSADQALAEKRPPNILLGTSSWSFRGWNGLVYRGNPTQEELVDHGLEEYARHPLFSTVGIDRSHYAPLLPEELQKYSRQLPLGFKCVTKVWSAITSYVDPRTRAPNPQFLDAGFFTDAVLTPTEKYFHDHQGPFLLQMLPLSRSEVPDPRRFAWKLNQFLAQVPRHYEYAVELRNVELFTQEYLEVLAKHGASHVFNHWEKMPPIEKQLAHEGTLPAKTVVSRLLLPQGGNYEQLREAFAPFDRLQEPDEAMRQSVIELAKRCIVDKRTLYIIVNNKAEGSSPLTVRALLELLAKLPQPAPT